jgi:hypothetical protein
MLHQVSEAIRDLQTIFKELAVLIIDQVCSKFGSKSG